MKTAKIVFGFGMIVSIILCSGLAVLFNSATHYGGIAPVQFASAGETAPTWSVISSIEITNGSMKSVVRLGGDSNVSAGIIMEANNSTLSMAIETGDSASISGNINASGDYIYAESYAKNQNNSARINVSVAESELNMRMNTEASSEKTGAAVNLSAEGNNIWLGAYSNDTELYRGFFKGHVKGMLYADEYSGFFIPFTPLPVQTRILKQCSECANAKISNQSKFKSELCKAGMDAEP
jgi:hypothetical protein